MNVRRDLSMASPAMLGEAEAIVEQARDADQLWNFALQLWPSLWVYKDTPGYRLVPRGRPEEFIVIEFCEPTLEAVEIRRAAA